MMKKTGAFLVVISALMLIPAFQVAACGSYTPDNPPIIAGLPDQTVTVGQSISILDLFIYASDVEDYNYELVFSIESQSNPSVITCYVTGNSYLACGNAQMAGYSDITVKVTDTCGLSDTDTFRITANSQQPVNTPPVISGIQDYTINVGQYISTIDLFAFASDVQDSDSSLLLAIDSQSDPTVISCSIASGRYLQCGAGQKAGFSEIIIRATDTGGLFDTDLFRITVQGVSPVNTPPVISGIPDSTVNVGQTINMLDLFAYASDTQDPDTSLIFYIDSQSNPSAISCYISGNRYVSCGSGQKAGFSDITVRVTDTGGLSSSDTFRITVQGQPPAEDHSPLINSLIITPSSPQDADTLACTAQVSDQDGNLDRVQFKWFVNGGLDKTRTVYVAGSSSTAQDTLDSTRSGIDDQVRCEATVYDAMGLQDTDLDTVAIQRQDCGVDVFNVEVVDSRIIFSIRNMGNSVQAESYQVYVDGYLITQSSVTLSPGEMEIIQIPRTFGIGSFIIKAKATSQCGATDSESIVHQVLDPCPGTPSCPNPNPQPGDQDPSVDSISITPANPDEFDDLACRVAVSDDDNDLDRVQFKWIVEGYVERTRTIYVSGDYDVAEDTLSSGFSSGDDVECEAVVYDDRGRSDSARDSVVIYGDGNDNDRDCDIDVFNLRSVGNRVTFEVLNNGDFGEYIDYTIYVENQVVKQYRAFLYSGERKTIEESFYFGSADYYVKVRVTTECGSTDWESTYHQGDGACTAKYLDEYRCENKWRMQRYQNSDCSSVWINVESCPDGCSGGYCSGYVPPSPCTYGYCPGPTPTPSQCGASVLKFDYQSNIMQNQALTVLGEAKNTGNSRQNIDLLLYVDGQLVGSQPGSMAAGESFQRLFYYYPSPGTHNVQIKAQSSCGSTDTRTATITVRSLQQAPDPTPVQTAVSIYPSAIDTSFCEAKFITINVHSSKSQVFTTTVSGIAPEWVSYQSQNILQAGEDRNLYIFASPKEIGEHRMTVTVTAESENKAYNQEVVVYTAPCRDEQAAGDGITGALIKTAQSPWFWVILIIIVAGIVIFLGSRRLKPDIEYYEPTYPIRAERRE